MEDIMRTLQSMSLGSYMLIAKALFKLGYDPRHLINYKVIVNTDTVEIYDHDTRVRVVIPREMLQ